MQPYLLTCNPTTYKTATLNTFTDLISDTESQTKEQIFLNKVVRYLYEKTCVSHHITSPYHPQGNGLVERLNCTTTDRLKVLIEKTGRLGTMPPNSSLDTQI